MMTKILLKFMPTIFDKNLNGAPYIMFITFGGKI